MKEQIDSIIKNHCLRMQKVDQTKSIPIIVKQLDTIIYEMYHELYGLRDIGANNQYLNSFTAVDKKGHCC